VTNNDTMQGEVIFWLEERGFGFVSRDDGGHDVFFHRTRLCDIGLLPTKGMRVSYQIITDQRTGKLAAVDVKPI
jgi:cold shock protein